MLVVHADALTDITDVPIPYSRALQIPYSRTLQIPYSHALQIPYSRALQIPYSRAFKVAKQPQRSAQSVTKGLEA